MNILLLSMPDSFEHTAPVDDADAERRARRRWPATSTRIIASPSPTSSSCSARCAPPSNASCASIDPDVVGLSIMTFQRGTARKIVALVRALKPSVQRSSSAATIRASRPTSTSSRPGTSTSSCAAKATSRSASWCARSSAARTSARGRPVVSRRRPASCARRIARSARSPATEVRLPNRAARVLDGYTFLGRPIDVVETSRGCTYDCSFCSIIEMRGRNFHTWSIERVIADIADARRARRPRDLHRRRQHHAQRGSLRAALPRDRRRPASTTSTTSCRR